MGKVVNRSDLVGKFNVPIAQEWADYIDELITSTEKDYFEVLFGTKIGKELIDYNSSDSPDYIKKIVDGEEYSYAGNKYRYTGLKDCLIYFIYYEVRKAMGTEKTPEGIITTKHKAAYVASKNEKRDEMYEMYNEGVSAFIYSVKPYILAVLNIELTDLSYKSLIRY